MTDQDGAFVPPPGPLAAPPSKRRFVVVMAFFAALFLASVAGFFLTWDGKERVATIGGSIGGRDAVTPGPLTRTVSPPSASPTGPVPKPVTYRGSGDDVVPIRKPESGLALVYLKGNAAGDTFTVSALDRNGTKIGLLVATFDPYEGVRPIDTVTSFPETASLEIEATGAWTVQVRSPRSAPVFTGTTRGRGDSVVRYLGDGGVATLKGGVANKSFTVTTHVDGFPRLLVVGVGPYSGSKSWPRGDVLVEVQAPGAWSIAVR